MELLTPHVLAEIASLSASGVLVKNFTVADFEAKFAKSPFEMREEGSLKGWLTDVLGSESSGMQGRVHYVNNPGNFGDALIACVGFMTLKSAGLDFQTKLRRMRMPLGEDG